jgi:NADPH:quinone reductase-like Zn-dependent oxidoreductase
MKAQVLYEHGGVDVLRAEELPDPTPGPREVLVRVRAVALNHLDLWVRGGLPGLKLAYPHRLGSDIAGEIVALGPGASGVEVGQKVLLNPGLSCGHCRECLSGRDNLCARYRIIGESAQGGYSEFFAAPVENVLPFPQKLSFAEAATLPLTFLTAWQMLVLKAQVKPGETVLVLGASSGVGVAAIQIAKLFRARVIAASSTEAKRARALALGADEAVPTDRFFAETRRLTDKRGVDIVVEHVGQETWESSLKILVPGGRLVTCGATSGFEAKTDLRYVFFRQAQILGSTMGPKGSLFDILSHVEAGRLKPVLDRAMPLADAREAHRALEAKEQFGKIVLVP